MFAKTLLLGALVASAPLCLLSARPALPQDAAPAADAAAAERLATLERLQREVREARAEVQQLRGELGECLDQLDLAMMPAREPDCTPSRALHLHYQWLHQRGHEQRKQKVLDKISEQHRNRPESLDELARQLMNHKDSAGKHDALALALTQRVLASGNPRHRSLDTAAQAHFLAGHVARAVELQRAALAEADHDEYRRRLRTYEAALSFHGPVKPTVAAEIASSGD